MLERTVRRAVIVGSSPDAIRAAPWIDLVRSCKFVAINNAWRISERFDYFICPNDFPETQRPPDTFKGRSVVGARIDSFGQIIFRGSTMSFNAGYWTIENIPCDAIGYIGCDMIYSPDNAGNTHFYGTGKPDPLRRHISLRSLEAKSARLHHFARMSGKAVFRLSSCEESRLTYPRISLEDFFDDNVLLQRSKRQKHLTRDYFHAVHNAMALELASPFDPRDPDYRFFRRKSSYTSYVDRIDAAWLATRGLGGERQPKTG